MEIYAGLDFVLTDGGSERRGILVCRDESDGTYWSFLESDYGNEVYSSAEPDADALISANIANMAQAGWTHTGTSHP